MRLSCIRCAVDLIFILLLHRCIFITAKCPHSCSCDNASVVCTCDDIMGDSNGTKLVLKELNDFQFLHSIIIHSCDTVVIAADAFNGLALSHRFKIINVKNVIIEAFAFRGLKYFPPELMFENVAFNRITTNAFSGLMHLKYFWFRNVSIGHIRSYAFDNLTTVDYMYFRDANISSIDAYAFGNLHRVNHLFFRGTINIYSLNNYAFKDSAIKVLVFEGNLQTTKYFLQKGKFRRVELLNCHWRLNNNNDNQPDTTAIRTKILADVVKLLNCTIERLDVAVLSGITTILVESCQIGRVDSVDKQPAAGIDSLLFRETRIGNIVNVTLTSTVDVRFERCQIDKLSAGCLQLLNVAEVVFRKCKIRELSMTSFYQFQIPFLCFDYCWLNAVDSNVLSNVIVDDLIFNNTYFGTIKREAFANITANRLFLLNCKVNDIEASPFLNAQIGHLIMGSNELLAGDFKTIFYGLDAQRLDATNNSFVCDEDDCETNSLFCTKTLHQISWSFEANSCVQSEACKTEPQWSNQNMLCKFSRSIVKCYCKNDTPALVPFVNTSILLMSNCAYLDLNSDAGLYLSKLYIFYSNLILIHNLPSHLKSLTIVQSKALLKSGSFSGTSLRHFELVSSKIDNFEAYALQNSTIDNFLLHNSKIRQAETKAFDGAKIVHFLGNKSEFYEMDTFWSKAVNVTLLNSYVDKPQQLFDVSALCFKSLIVNCECGSDYSNLSARNTCDDDDLVCGEGSLRQNAACSLSSSAIGSPRFREQLNKLSLLLLYSVILQTSSTLFYNSGYASFVAVRVF